MLVSSSLFPFSLLTTLIIVLLLKLNLPKIWSVFQFWVFSGSVLDCTLETSFPCTSYSTWCMSLPIANGHFSSMGWTHLTCLHLLTYKSESRGREIRIIKMPVRLICDLYSKVDYIIDLRFGLPKDRSTSKWPLYICKCTYVHTHICWKQKSFINFQCFARENGWVCWVWSKAEEIRWTDDAEGIAVGCSGQGRISEKENSELNSGHFCGFKHGVIICRFIYHTGMSRMQRQIFQIQIW